MTDIGPNRVKQRLRSLAAGAGSGLLVGLLAFGADDLRERGLGRGDALSRTDVRRVVASSRLHARAADLARTSPVIAAALGGAPGTVALEDCALEDDDGLTRARLRLALAGPAGAGWLEVEASRPRGDRRAAWTAQARFVQGVAPPVELPFAP
ncbi:MAG: hypothetical protein M9894_30235 [Planctomycetes bacterium]|nr:hypothetical protein [Planctomycetota bacterium]